MSVELILQDLLDYLEHLGRSRVYPAFFWLGVALFGVIGIGAGLYLDVNPEGVGYALFEPARVSGLNWAIYVDYDEVSRYISIFWYLVSYCAIWFGLSLLWRDYSVFVFLKSKSRDLGPPQQLFNRYAAKILADLRAGRIRPGSGFDVPSYMHRLAAKEAGLLFLAATVLSVILAGFWYLDRMSYVLLTESHIEYTDYWTTKVHKIGYDEVDKVKITCRGKGINDLILEYDIEFADGRTALAAYFSFPRRFRERLKGHLPDWQRVDAKLRSSGVPIVHPIFNSITITDRQEFNERQCRSGLVELVGAETAEQVLALLEKSP